MVKITIDTDEYNEPTCPSATTDKATSDAMKETAVEQGNYRKVGGDGSFVASKSCASCRAYNITPEIQACLDDKSGDTGYCNIFSFVCAADHVCSRWIEGGPMDGSDDRRPIPGGKRDID